VALDANPSSGPVLWYGGGWTGRIGGTSASAPLWASYTALINARRAMLGYPRVGFLNPAIYALCSGSDYDMDFHDIADGSTNVDYPAVTGYDLVTGWGAYRGYNLVDDLTDPDRAIWSWGDNTCGELGPEAPSGASPTAAMSPQLAGIVQLAVGLNFASALRSDGSVWSWGYNVDGELGNGAYSTASNPTVAVPGEVSGLASVLAISAGGEHTAALRSDGTIWSWGDNRYGELGNGATASSAPYGSDVPVEANSITGAIGVSAGAAHSLAVTSSETVCAWGDNTYGQLGTGSLAASNVPVALSGLSGIVAVAAGAHHSLALGANGTVWAWGYNSSGELGYGSVGSTSTTPTQLSGISGVVAIAAGGVYSGPGFSLALRCDGTVWAWGDNSSGELGNCSFTASQIPVRVTGVSGAVGIAAGKYHAMALTDTGAVWAWGANGSGQLGNGTTNGNSGQNDGVAMPAVVASLPGTMTIAAGGNSSLVVGRGIEYSVSGTIDPIGAINGAQGPITFTFHNLSGSEFAYTTTPAANGAFTVAGVPPGTYNIGILGPKWLRTTLTGVTVNANLTGVNASLLPGDLNGDNVVDIDDFTLLISAFGSDPTTGNWNINADLNGDGVVDIEDFSLLAADYGLTGDPAP
jgi:alpha-tubulin suppressor-like RCC1 family protein